MPLIPRYSGTASSSTCRSRPPTVQYAVERTGRPYPRRLARGLSVQYYVARAPPCPTQPDLPDPGAANPASVNYLYFVATGDERRHRSSSTLAAHNAAVALYRLGRNR